MPAPIALTIAGSDSSGGAGLQADLRTFGAFRVYGASVVTAITAQNTTGVQRVWPLAGELVAGQLASVLDDLHPTAIKIGMLGSRAALEAVLAGGIDGALPIVFDPILAASDGTSLADGVADDEPFTQLLRRAALVTPNALEAAQLTGWPFEDVQSDPAGAARALGARGARAVLLKGGHLAGERCVDTLWLADRHEPVQISGPRLNVRNTHGTGCVLSSAIAANLALGRTLEDAVRRARSFQTASLEAAAQERIGSGPGPLWPAPDPAP